MDTPLVNTDWLRRNFEDPELIILDGSPESNKANMTVKHPGIRIIGARAFGIKEHFSDIKSRLPNMIPSSQEFTKACRALGINASSKIVVYDNLDLYSSPRVWWMLKTMGHDKVAVLDGGLNDWISSGGATEPISTPSYIEGNFVAKYDATKVINAAQILRNIQAQNFSVIDARSAGRFNAEVPEPRLDSRSGHIPGSYNLPFAKLCRDGTFLPKDELKALFDKMGLGDEALVFTCGSGMTACIGILGAALVLDNELGLYDGSWSEWGDANGEWPVAVPE